MSSPWSLLQHKWGNGTLSSSQEWHVVQWHEPEPQTVLCLLQTPVCAGNPVLKKTTVAVIEHYTCVRLFIVVTGNAGNQSDGDRDLQWDVHFTAFFCYC